MPDATAVAHAGRVQVEVSAPAPPLLPSFAQTASGGLQLPALGAAARATPALALRNTQRVDLRLIDIDAHAQKSAAEGPSPAGTTAQVPAPPPLFMDAPRCELLPPAPPPPMLPSSLLAPPVDTLPPVPAPVSSLVRVAPGPVAPSTDSASGALASSSPASSDSHTDVAVDVNLAVAPPAHAAAAPQVSTESARLRAAPATAESSSTRARAAQSAAVSTLDDVLAVAWARVRGRTVLAGGTAILLCATVACVVSVLGMVALGPLWGGLVVVALRLATGRPIALDDFFAGMRCFVPLAIAGVSIAVCTLLGLIVLVVPGLYVALVTMYVPFLILDRGDDVWSAVHASQRAVHGAFLSHVGLACVVAIINVAAVASIVGPLFTLPFSFVVLAVAYGRVLGYAHGVEKYS